MRSIYIQSLTAGLSNADGISEFWDKIKQLILKTLYDPLYKSVSNDYSDMFSLLNTQVNDATTNIYSGPRYWGGGLPFGTVQKVAENICIPIAAAFITVIFCWELIHMVQESNSMSSENAKPKKLMLVLMKFGLCLLVCAKSFDIIMAFFDVGAWASMKLGEFSSSSIRGFTVDLNNALLENPDVYTVEDLMQLCGYKIMLFFGKLGVCVCGVIVYIRIMLWFLEILLYASTAPIPYSTWINKEWSQVGMNYTRKMLALSFEGFFMLLLFAIYGSVLAGLSQGDFMQNMVMIIGCGFALAVMMFKTGNISASIFNAH